LALVSLGFWLLAFGRTSVECMYCSLHITCYNFIQYTAYAAYM
jgi:hypothetical protein